MNASATEDNGQVIAKIGCDNIQLTPQQAQMLGEQLIESAHLARNVCWHHNAPTGNQAGREPFGVAEK